VELALLFLSNEKGKIKNGKNKKKVVGSNIQESRQSGPPIGRFGVPCGGKT
jgi:hypothetical protein